VSAGPEELIRDEVRAMKAYAVAQADGLVKLDAMENPYGLPAALQREIAEAVSRVAINRYPDPTAPALVTRLRETMRIPAGLDVLLGNGSDEIIHIVDQAVARRGAVVLAPRPSFVMFSGYATLAGLEYVGVLLTGALATVWTAPPVVIGAAVVMGIAVIAIAILRREVIRVE